MCIALEIIINIKQFNPGRMALNPFIRNDSMYMVYPQSDDFMIDHGLSDIVID